MKRINGEQAAPIIPAGGGVPSTPVTSEQLALMCEQLHQLIEQQKLTNALLMGIVE
jgi:hypothetical protein